MKKLTLTFLICLFTVLLSAPSYAEWTKVSGSVAYTSYVDFERIRKHDGDIYFWELFDYVKPSPVGTMSAKRYRQGDCKIFRFKILSSVFYREPMGQGTPSSSWDKPDKEWSYPVPNTTNETILKAVCSR
jgi:hypothetical protein